VRDCRRCGDDDLRRRLHGPTQAGRRCLDVSGAASCAVLQLCSTESLKLTMQPTVLCWLCNKGRCQQCRNKHVAVEVCCSRVRFA
jgi:hypothetical protein